MNLRISEHQLRFRITKDELENLRTGTKLVLSLPMGEKPPVYTVVLCDDKQPLALHFVDQLSWELRVSREALEAFAQFLPSREGIEHEIHTGKLPLLLVLEVDVRRRS